MRSVKRLGMTTDWSRSECGCLVVRFDIISMLYLDSCLITGLYFACCIVLVVCVFFFFSSRRRHTRSLCDWSSDVCSSDLVDDQVRSGTLRSTRLHGVHLGVAGEAVSTEVFRIVLDHRLELVFVEPRVPGAEIGRASCRERGWVLVVDGRLKAKEDISGCSR